MIWTSAVVPLDPRPFHGAINAAKKLPHFIFWGLVPFIKKAARDFVASIQHF
jgi:hypothetical protein